METQTVEYCKFCDLTAYHDFYDKQRHKCCQRCITCSNPDRKHIEYVLTNPMVSDISDINDLLLSYFGDCENGYYNDEVNCRQFAGYTVTVRIINDAGTLIRSAYLMTFRDEKTWLF